MKRIIRSSECNTFEEVRKLIQELFDIASTNDEHNAAIDEYNKAAMKGNKDA